MTYINQIIKETLRIRGPITKIVNRVSAEDTVLSDIFIPKGTLLTANIFDTQHSSTLWKDPDTFNPERFAEDGESTCGAGESMAWLAFGNGARQFIDINLTLNEQRVMLPMLLRKYTWTVHENSKHKDGLITNSVDVIGPVDLDIAFHKRYQIYFISHSCTLSCTFFFANRYVSLKFLLK